MCTSVRVWLRLCMYLNDVGIVTMPFERGLENDRPRKRESV